MYVAKNNVAYCLITSYQTGGKREWMHEAGSCIFRTFWVYRGIDYFYNIIKSKNISFFCLQSKKGMWEIAAEYVRIGLREWEERFMNNISCTVYLNMSSRRRVTLCNHNFSEEGIYHPDRVMQEYDLLYMQNGHWDIVEDGKSYRVGPNQVILLEPGKRHYSTNRCEPSMRNAYIHFACEPGDGVVLDDGRGADPGVEQGMEAGSSLAIGKVTDCNGQHEVLHLFEQIIDAFFAKEGCDRELRMGILMDQLLLLLADQRQMETAPSDVWVQEIIHRIHCHPEVFLSPQELADSYHVSVRTLSRRFKAQTGMSVHQYQIDCKLDMAYDEIPFVPNRTMRDIAKGYGFYDEFQFSKLFKRRFSIPPSARR